MFENITNIQWAVIITIILIIGILVIHFIAIKNILVENEKIKEKIDDIWEEIDKQPDVSSHEERIQFLEKESRNRNEIPNLEKVK